MIRLLSIWDRPTNFLCDVLLSFTILDPYALLSQSLRLPGLLANVHVHSNLHLPKGIIFTSLTVVSVFYISLFFLLYSVTFW